MRLLLDTDTFLWWVSDWAEIDETTRDAIADPGNEVFVSAVSGLEIAVRKAQGRLVAPDSLSPVVEAKHFEHLPLTFTPKEPRLCRRIIVTRSTGC